MTRGAIAIAIAIALLPACGPSQGDAFLSAFAAGQRSYHAGRYEEAAATFSDAAGKALRVKDRDEARLLEARSYQRAEAWDKARTAYRRLLADSPSGPRSPRAEFELAELAIDHGDADRGWALLLAATRKHPTHGVARKALHDLVMHEDDRGGPTAAIAWLRSEGKAFRGTELDQVAGYELGLALDRGGDREGAVRALVATARAHPYPSGALTDNALFRAAQIQRDLGRPEDAIRTLRELLAPRERAATGSYERPLFDDAQLAIAVIYRDALKDRAAARREFHKLYTDHPASILRDDALWAEARLWRDDGATDEACAAASRLARELADSRYARCVQHVCPSLPAAARPCADYILRELKDQERHGAPPEGDDHDEAGR